MGRDRQITRHHGAASTSGLIHSTLLPVWKLGRWAQSASRGDADASHSPKSLV
jgi:hypothetical protein